MEREYIVPVGEGLYSVNTGDWRTRRPVMDEDKCIGCGICYLYCPVFCIEPVQENLNKLRLLQGLWHLRS